MHIFILLLKGRNLANITATFYSCLPILRNTISHLEITRNC